MEVEHEIKNSAMYKMEIGCEKRESTPRILTS